MKAEIYTKDNCPYCIKAKHLMEKHGIEYVEIAVTEEGRETLMERVQAATGAPPRTVPQIWLDQEYIGGHDQLVAWLGRQTDQ